MEETVQVPRSLLGRMAEFLDRRLEREYFAAETTEDAHEIQAIVDRRYPDETKFVGLALDYLSKFEEM